MTTTVQELIANLKHHPDNTVITIKDVEDQEFAIVGLRLENGSLSIVITDEDEDEEEEESEAA